MSIATLRMPEGPIETGVPCDIGVVLDVASDWDETYTIEYDNEQGMDAAPRTITVEEGQVQRYETFTPGVSPGPNAAVTGTLFKNGQPTGDSAQALWAD
jgi:hypothetical protein